MQCLVKKRRHEPQLQPQLEPQPEPWSCSAKRVCTEAEVHSAECPMDTSSPLTGSRQQEDRQQVRPAPPRPPLCCPRCLGGEPGHFNHMVNQ